MTNDDMTDRLRIGVVVPRADSQVPAEAALMYPEIEFVAAGVGVSALTPEGYESAWHGIVPAAAKLAEQGVHAVMVMGASLTFYRGYQSHEELMQNVQRVTGLPVSSMSAAAVDALRELEVRNVGVCTAYSDEINERLGRFLADSGFTVCALRGLGLENFDAPRQVGPHDVISLVRCAVEESSSGVQGLLISCGGLKTLDLTPQLEREHGLPVVSSTPAALRSAAHLLGVGHGLAGLGRLLGRHQPST